MKSVMLGMCAAALCGHVVMTAQSGTMDKGQMDQKMMKDGTMTVTGCVAAGKSAGQYMLSDAMMSGSSMSGGMTSDKDKMAKPGMSGDHKMMSYELMGGELKPHMGHKVEVMGMLDKASMDMMGKMSEKEKMDKMGSMAPMKLQVKSVKMISATCP